MIVDDKLLTKLENLSMIKIDENKKEKLKGELSEILGFVAKLETINTASVEPTSSPLNRNAILREDTPIDNSHMIKTMIEHAPKAKDNCFVVPRVVG